MPNWFPLSNKRSDLSHLNIFAIQRLRDSLINIHVLSLRGIGDLGLHRKFKVQIRLVEEREKDYWFDMSLRSLREGRVRYYRVRDILTGEWLFKVCRDEEMKRVIVKALKCPAGGGFAQLEGKTMLFQKGLIEGYYYDVISLSYVDEDNRLRRMLLNSIDEVPEMIREGFRVMEYAEAVGGVRGGKKVVVLCEENDERGMILLFLMERAWPILKASPETLMKASSLLRLIKDLEKARLEEVYESAERQLSLKKEVVDALLSLLEEEELIHRLEEYVKTKD